MAGFLFALLATLIVGLGAGDQVQVAGLALRQGRRPALLAVAAATGIGTALAACWAAARMLPQVPDPARPLVVAIALALAGFDLVVRGRPAVPAEPTRSLGAVGIVLLARQLTDAARFVLFGLALATGTPGTVAAGGALGSALVVLGGWLGGGRLLAWPLPAARRLAGSGLIALAAVIAWQAR